ncbi:MAG: hypothetical protein RXR06_12100 [Thermoproteus sp.]
MASELWGTLRFVDMDIFQDLHGRGGEIVFNKDLTFISHTFWLSVQNARDYINLYGRFYWSASFELSDEVDLAPVWLFLNHLRILSMKNKFSMSLIINVYTIIHAVGQHRAAELVFTSITEELSTSGFGYKWERARRGVTSFSGFVHPMIARSPLLV